MGINKGGRIAFFSFSIFIFNIGPVKPLPTALPLFSFFFWDSLGPHHSLPLSPASAFTTFFLARKKNPSLAYYMPTPDDAFRSFPCLR